MAHVFADRVADTSSTTGTSPFALDDEIPTAYRSFDDVCADADTIYYCAAHQSLDEWEVGLGTYGSGTNVLTRTTVYASSNSGSTVNFSSGTKHIFGTFPAQALASTGLTVGTSGITGGTNTRVLYNNAGVLGEYAISGTGSVAMTTSPTFVTPALGTPSSGVLTNCTGLPSIVVANEATDTTCFLLFATAATGELAPKSNANLAFNSNTGVLSLTNAALTTPNIGTPSAGTLTNCTGLTSILVADTTDSTCFVALWESATGELGPKSDAALTYDATTGALTATSFVGALTGNAATVTWADEASDTTCFIGFATAASGSLAPKTNTNMTFNASTGVATFGQTIVGSVNGNAATVTVADAGADTTTWVLLGTSQTGNLSPASDGGLTYNANTNALTATTFVGALTGNADTVTWADEASDTTCFIGFATAASGSLAPKTNTNMTFNSSTGVATFASTVLTTTDINGGTVDGTVIGGASAAAITGTTITANTGFMPDANDGAYLGQSGTAFSDLFLASGGVLNWNAGNYTVTHSAGLLTTNGRFNVNLNSAAVNATGFSPLMVLVGADGATLNELQIQGYNDSFVGNGLVTYAKARGTAASPAAVQSGDRLGANFAWGYATSGGAGFVLTAGAGFIMAATENYTASAAGSELEILTTPNGSATLATAATFGHDKSLTIGGWLGRGAPVTKTGDFSVATTENWIIVNNGATTTVTMPTASDFPGREIYMKTIQAQLVNSSASNVVPNTTATAGTAILPATDGAWCSMVSDGTNWIRMASSTIA